MTDAASSDVLTNQVRELLKSVLRQADFPGSDELLRQASSVNVVGGPITMLDLLVSNTLPASAFADGPVPLSVWVSNAAGRLVGELLVWVGYGYLTGLEFAWWTDDPPDRLPTLDHLRVIRK
ncbi:hypothetical protein [Amycolatopsis pithecellobii]|uniref:Uncharacterized protein n=1 Tax=Amycolatopsis pithecellobii TaxID=664692 RepID=A0A6N7Z5U5_9PSEU|nr:hypothetical protein [Amycolatopsis pithecellobii]MTD56094.1 hypothetical protein [Amycolatopsis pithecellobii]